MTSPPPFLFTTAGDWVALDSDPVRDLAGDGPDRAFDELAADASYSPWTEYPDPDWEVLSLSIFVAGEKALEHRAPRFLVAVSTQLEDHREVVYAESTPALMDLLARWAPALQSAAITRLISELKQPEGNNNPLARLIRHKLGAPD